MAYEMLFSVASVPRPPPPSRLAVQKESELAEDVRKPGRCAGEVESPLSKSG